MRQQPPVKPTVLARPSLNDLMKIIAFLIEHKANCNLQDRDGNTIVMRAAHKFDFTMLSTVIGEGADPSIPNKEGDTPKSFLEKNRSNKPKGYSKEEMDFLIEKAFEPPKEKGE
ncbi:MAG: ankyrin repeat domain-containing protein [Candidatus Cardinium sp.]|nr:MAG: ankyrin repeat domain-containing protein [Candidatus Cardinium sp.]